MTTDTQLMPDEAYALLQHMFAIFMNPEATQEELTVFLTPEYEQSGNGQRLDREDFLLHHKALQKAILSAQLRFEHFVSDGVSAATVHIVEATKRSGEQVCFQVIANYKFLGRRISLVDEMILMVRSKQQDQDLGSRTISEEALDVYCAPWRGPVGQAVFYRQIAQMDQRFTDEIEPLYGRLDCPVRVLWGQEDGWIPFEKGKVLAKLISDREVVRVSDAGHLVQEDRPEVLVAEVIKTII